MNAAEALAHFRAQRAEVEDAWHAQARRWANEDAVRDAERRVAEERYRQGRRDHVAAFMAAAKANGWGDLPEDLRDDAPPAEA